MNAKYPFKFLNSYGKEDSNIFFGRDEEINELYEMVFQTSVILVYGGSGTGKTSLIDCGLAGKFQPHDWLALMIRRGANINDSLKKVLDSEGGQISSTLNDNNYNDEWSDDSPSTTKELSKIAQSIKAVYQKSFRPVYLIFDQFEELFILGTANELDTFIKTVQDILQSDQPVKIIFAIREEYLGYLFEFERAVPQLTRKKLRIEPMNFEKVKQVIIGASSYENSNVKLKPGEEDQIAKGIFDKIKGKEKSLTIQLPFLQVFLDKFYLKITGDESRTAQAVFTMQALNEMGEIGDVLINFLDEQVNSISENLKSRYPDLTKDMTWRMLSPFSTLEGTKEPISKEGLRERLTEADPKLIDEIITAFTNSRILRYNDATDMYEIAHDALAKPIAEKRSVEEKNLLEIKRQIKSQVAVKAEAREFFTEKQLLSFESHLDKIKISDIEKEWISKSRAFNKTLKDAADQKQLAELGKERRQKRLILGIAISLIVTFGALYLLYFANQQRNFALIAKSNAVIEKDRAIEAKRIAEDYAKKIEESIKLSGYGISQEQISKFDSNDFTRIVALTKQIDLLKNQVDTFFTIQYYQKFDDEDKAIGILKDLGFEVVEKVTQEYMKNTTTNCFWIGDNVNEKIENVKFIALCLMRAGINLQAIRLLNNPANRPSLIQIGGDKRITDSDSNYPPWTLEQIMNLKSGDIDRIGKAK